MNAPSEKQIGFIRSLVAERQAYLAEHRPSWLVAPQSIKDASRIIELLRAVPRDPVERDPREVSAINELRTLLNSMTTRDAGFASSLIRQYDERGTLSTKQWACITDLVNRIGKPEPKPVEPGLYVLDDQVIKVYLTQNHRLATKALVPQPNGTGSFVYVRGLLSRLTDEHRLTEEQARAYGRQYGFCVACARPLNDDRSIAVGYGQTCADNHGWFYPTQEQAGELLARPAR